MTRLFYRANIFKITERNDKLWHFAQAAEVSWRTAQNSALPAEHQQKSSKTQGIKVTDTTSSYDKNDIEKNKVLCAVSYISILFFLPLVACPESRFGKFHANQALILLIASVILGAAGGALYTILWALPLIPNFIKTLVDTALDIVLWAAPVAGMIFGIVNAAQGKAKEIPLIGKFNLINK